ncbi:UDP-glucose 4-epimerase [Marinobacter nitratireducens]|uniref:UDP-glucose 4-epimerase n=1 Tax=Marinobacter nitratireducens TaxID=1137280 RepID=A0A072N359_9GAMM|nr:NAD-dependent epimerase/dehydratase family protein [Marinobacter nitratireducens]KEF31637.1 UDP-glucose 4-epimerase [Marinobacter nitratireducens]
MKVFVLGGTGFIGSHIVARLRVQGHEVSVGSRGNSGNRFHGVAYHEVDLASGRGLLDALIGVDLVIHCASATVPASSAVNPESDIESNLVGTLKLLEIMREINVKKMVYLSSGGTVYGEPADNPVPESHPLNPISSYGVVKVAVEHYLEIASREWGLEKIIFRPSNPYGEGQVNKAGQGLIAAVISCALHNKPVSIFGDGNTVRDYIYVGDLALLISKSVTFEKTGTFNAGSGLGVSVNEIVNKVEDISGRPLKKEFSEKRRFDVEKVVLDSRKSMSGFSWSPETELSLGIRKQFVWMEDVCFGRTVGPCL